MKISPLGDSALIVDFADESSDRERLLSHALSAATALEHAKIPGVVEVTSSYQSVAIFFDPTRIEPDIGNAAPIQLREQRPKPVLVLVIDRNG